MGPFGTDKKYKNVEDAIKSLDLGREILIENNNKLTEDYNSYIEQAKPYQEGINNIIGKINDIEKNIPSGNIEDGTDRKTSRRI
jgi:soluble cytochrome b562